MAAEDFWRAFRGWRRHRPFWGGLILLLSAAELFLSANLNLGGLELQLGPQGFLSYVLPLILLSCGLLVWFTPEQRLFYGVVALLAALYSFLGLNLGGFGIGMMLGIVGGGLVIAWRQPRRVVAGPSIDDVTEPTEPSLRPATLGDAEIVPGFPKHARDDKEPPTRALLLLFVPVAVAATVLVGGSRPAHAEDCPEGLPSRSTSPAAAVVRAKTKAPPAAKKSRTPVPAESPTPSPSASSASDSNPVKDFFEGIGRLLGIGDASSSSPSASASAPTSSAPTTAAPSSSAPSTSATSTSASAPKPSSSSDDIPCLGARQYGKTASADDIPAVGKKPGVMEVDSLTMYNSTYDGVVDMPVAGGGSFQALKFSMDKAVNKPFTLTIAERGGAHTVITSDELTTTGAVRFYTPEFKGNLFGLIPVTFTPESPPPLTLPVLWFTDVTIQLAYVRSDVLTGDPLKVAEKP